MKVFIERTREEKDCAPCSVQELLSSLNITPTEVLVMKNNTLITDDEVLEEADSIKILSVISGG